MSVLVTGGAGFIGSHTCVELLNSGREVVVYDNLSNSSKKSLERVMQITGKKLKFYEGDILDRARLEEVFAAEDIDSVIHFAGLKAVGESVVKPLEYYHNNITGTLILMDVMRNHGVKKIVFSSSATVYGKPAFVPITEECPKGEITNPYGQTKSMLEQILIDYAKADEEFAVVILRYFNPIGAHESGLIGENPKGIPNNLMPYITQVAVGKREKLSIFGDDYDTPDGTGVRDYIHVVDLAKGHICALDHIEERSGTYIYNLGTGKGVSVLELVHAFEEANDIKIPYVIAPRRSGDIDCNYADASLAKKEIGFEATKTIVDMCRDSYRWQTMNPNGYEDEKPEVTLVVMAAGIGSRYGGGIKQLEKVGPNGEILMDYSIRDAKAAGFNKVLFVIRHDIYDEFMEVIGNRISKFIDVDYAFQEIDDLPDGFTTSKDRLKPWGTGHAILACKGKIKGAFAIINADDYYGKEAYVKLYDFLSKQPSVVKDGRGEKLNICMAGFKLGNTLSDNGAVTRGVCMLNDDDILLGVKETSGIVKTAYGAAVKDDNGLKPINTNSPVSMNMWGVPATFVDVLESEFKLFLSKLDKDDIKSEFLLPVIIDNLVKSGRAVVTCLKTSDKWFGVTYKEDKQSVVDAIRELVAKA
ncbi:MAG: UDP-glucose 4-epimerase GalE [Lachnospiraceae bacterium]|nr:UDP-glucose 4-epimerase GalE [Lachnospiraceae bacterium]